MKGKKLRRCHWTLSSCCYTCCPQLNPVQHPATILPPCSTCASTATMQLQPCLWFSFNPQQRFFSPHSFFREVTSDPKLAFKWEPRTSVHWRQLFLKHLQNFSGVLWSIWKPVQHKTQPAAVLCVPPYNPQHVLSEALFFWNLSIVPQPNILI